MGEERKACDEEQKKEALFWAPSEEDSGLLLHSPLHVMSEPRRVPTRPPPSAGGRKPCSQSRPGRVRDAQRRDWLAASSIPQRERSAPLCPLGRPGQHVGEKQTGWGEMTLERPGNPAEQVRRCPRSPVITCGAPRLNPRSDSADSLQLENRLRTRRRFSDGSQAEAAREAQRDSRPQS